MNNFNENRIVAEHSTTLTNTSKSQLAKFDYSALDEEDRKYIQRYKERDIQRQQAYYLDTAKDLVEIQSRPDRAWRVKLQDKPAELPTVQPERAEEVAERFNYAVLTAELGDYLRHKEEQLRNEYMNFTANCGRIFAEAQEKLAKHGFGENNGVFDKWISSMGFAKPSVYRMISVYNFRSSQIETNEQAQLFDSLSKSLQYEIAKPSAPPELVEQVMNGDITTHKEYIKLKKELEETTMLFDYSALNNADCKIVKRLEAEFTKQQLELIIKINSAKEEVYNKLKEKNQLELYKPWCASLNIDWAEYEPTKEEFETLVENIVAKIIENAAN